MLWFCLIAALLGSVLALDNGLARTPPMGWMSWTAFLCETDCVKHPKACINENLYMEMADALVEGGYRDAGYVGVHVDDCWMERERNPANGRLVADRSRFPSGIRALARYMHDRGLTFGIYGDIGNLTCQAFPGSVHHMKKDAKTFARWGVDYLKVDGCHAKNKRMPREYEKMERALNSTGRPIVFSCSYPAYLGESVDYKQVAETCNLWRNYGDINNSWDSILNIIDWYDEHQDEYIPAHGPGHWNDPDMLVIGNPGITESMAIAQMTIWSIWSAPLIMSNDLRTIAPEFRRILLNRDVIAIDQDPMGKMGRLVKQESGVSIYVKPITPVYGSYTSFAIGLLNINNKPKKIPIFLNALGLTSQRGYLVQDLWKSKPVGLIRPDDELRLRVPGTGAALYRFELIEPDRYLESNRITGDEPNDF